MAKALIIEALRNPKKAILYLSHRIKLAYVLRVQRRTPFSFDEVVSIWNVKGSHLPHFASRLYREVKLLNDALGNYHVERSLEIGCGFGRLTPWIAEYSDHHYAVEPEVRLLHDAERLNPKVRFHRALAQALPYPDRYFDLCVTWTVLQHIPPSEIKKAIGEIKRVCKPGAVIILAEGVGLRRSENYWERALKEWVVLMYPWKLIWHVERKIEETFQGSAGLVMKFQLADNISKRGSSRFVMQKIS